MHLLYTELSSLVPVLWVLHLSGQYIMHLGTARNQICPCECSPRPQDALVVNLFVPGAGLVGTTLKWTKNSASGHCKESDDTPFAPVSAPQGPQDAPVVHLLVPGAGPVGHIKSGYGYCYSAQ